MFNPADASLHIKQEFIDYIITRYRFSDKALQLDFRKELERIVAKGPILDIKDAFRSSRTIADLVEDRTLCPDFLRLEANKPLQDHNMYRPKLPVTRPLYTHQEKAISVITGGHNAVITTGTGSGKTECFLIPVLDALLREEAAGTLNPGVRAILIYPMNALANDQMKRLREILMYHPSITFGVYNGDTKHKKVDAHAKYIDLHASEIYKELKEPLPNELISREQMQETPPHILCTNYAMLEHLLLRPDDNVLFQNASFRFVVLDEAHIYYGATGMETAFLLRRLKARLHTTRGVQFILTSATLGEHGKSEEGIIRFAENLTGESFSIADIIFGERLEQRFSISNSVPLDLFSYIACLQNLTSEELQRIYGKYRLSYHADLDAEENLYDLCYNAEMYQKMRVAASVPISIHDLAHTLSTSERSIIELVFICSQASKNGKALIDARYHFFLRALEGAYFIPSLGRFSLERILRVQENGIYHMAFELAICNNCGEYAFVGRLEKDVIGVEHLEQTSLFDSRKRFFQVIPSRDGDASDEVLEMDQSEIDEGEDDDEALPQTEKELSIKRYYLCTQCGAIADVDDGKPHCDCINPSHLIVREYIEGGINCPHCYGGKYYRLYLGTEAATAVLATSLFEELPVKEKVEVIGGVEESWRGGKQFLAFSDNRGEAAFFAPYLHKTYQEFLRRRAIVQILQHPPASLFDLVHGACTLEVFVDALKERFVQEHTFVNSLLPNCRPESREESQVAKQQAWVAILNELIREKSSDGLVGLGFLQFRYLGNNDRVVSWLSEKYCVDKERVQALVDALVATIIAFGAIATPDNCNLTSEDKKYVFYPVKLISYLML